LVNLAVPGTCQCRGNPHGQVSVAVSLGHARRAGTIRDHGYAISRVQRVGIGFTGMGYKTDKYRIVFFGKIDEVRNLAEKESQMIPYLPPMRSIGLFSSAWKVTFVLYSMM